LAAAERACVAEHGVAGAAFVEDSLLLGGSRGALAALARELERRPPAASWGAQLTVDLALQLGAELRTLHALGLCYVFLGIETSAPAEIGGMSKDIRSSEAWVSRAERAIASLTDAGIATGASLLFGAGESRTARVRLLEALARWRALHGGPEVISANWAVQHPLMSTSRDPAYDYLQWDAPPAVADLLRHFGEGSWHYPLIGVARPTEEELREVVDGLGELASPPARSSSPGLVSCERARLGHASKRRFG
jgi:hypothetical protein